MRATSRSLLGAALAASVAAVIARPADAAETEGTTDAEEAPAETPAAATEEATESPEKGDKEEAVKDAETGESAVELPGKTYRFVGLRYRGIIVPKFMVNLFADGGRTVYVHGIGPEFAIRKDGFEYNLSMWLAFYGMEPTPFKDSTDPDRAWEIIESHIKILYLTSDFLWSHEFSPELSLNYGVGAGFGIVFGALDRTQAYPPAGVTDPYKYLPCRGLGDPNAAYCDNENDHYPGYTEPSWAGGGSKPILFPWLALQTGLRFKASKNVVGRLDLGFGTSGFFFGIGADYGLL